MKKKLSLIVISLVFSMFFILSNNTSANDLDDLVNTLDNITNQMEKTLKVNAEMGKAVRDGDAKKVEYMIENFPSYKVVNANIQNEENKILWVWPLTLAVDKGHIKIVEILIKNGADVNREETVISKSPGMTALKLAKRKNNKKIIGILKKAGAKK